MAATLAGHAHVDGYCRDATGIHHRVCHGVVETPPGVDCWGVLDVHVDHILVRGAGTFGSARWELLPAAAPGAEGGDTGGTGLAESSGRLHVSDASAASEAAGP